MLVYYYTGNMKVSCNFTYTSSSTLYLQYLGLFFSHPCKINVLLCDYQSQIIRFSYIHSKSKLCLKINLHSHFSCFCINISNYLYLAQHTQLHEKFHVSDKNILQKYSALCSRRKCLWHLRRFTFSSISSSEFLWPPCYEGYRWRDWELELPLYWGHGPLWSDLSRPWWRFERGGKLWNHTRWAPQWGGRNR